MRKIKGEMMQICHTAIRPRYSETDQMGIVYHGNYFPWFELGRDDFFRESGYPYKRMEDMGIVMPVICCHCQYVASAKYDELIDIRTTLDFFNGVKMRLDFEVYSETDKKLLAKATVEYAFTSTLSKVLNIKKTNNDIWILFDKMSII